MKTLAFTLGLLATITANAQCVQTTSADKALLGASLVVKALDYSQTIKIKPGVLYDGHYVYEANPILGRYPSRGSINSLFIGTALLNVAVSCLASVEVSRVYLGVSTVGQLGFVINNNRLGLSLSLKF